MIVFNSSSKIEFRSYHKNNNYNIFNGYGHILLIDNFKGIKRSSNKTISNLMSIIQNHNNVIIMIRSNNIVLNNVKEINLNINYVDTYRTILQWDRK